MFHALSFPTQFQSERGLVYTFLPKPREDVFPFGGGLARSGPTWEGISQQVSLCVLVSLFVYTQLCVLGLLFSDSFMNIVEPLWSRWFSSMSIYGHYFPCRFKFIKYDEVCDNPLASLKTVMSFLNLPVTKPQEVILPSRKIGQNDKEIFSRADLWRRRSSFTQIVKPVQNYCRSSLEKLGLRIFVSEQDLHDLSIPTLSGPSGL